MTTHRKDDLVNEPPRRRARNTAARAAFQAARRRGLVTRHRLKLKHLDDHNSGPRHTCGRCQASVLIRDLVEHLAACRQTQAMHTCAYEQITRESPSTPPTQHPATAPRRQATRTQGGERGAT